MNPIKTPLDQRAVKRIVAALCLSTLAEWLGSTAVLPLLPVYLRHHGSSNALVGVTMAAFFAAALAVQYPIGRLSDRIGRRQVQIGGLVVFSVATVLFVFSSNPYLDLVFRALQGCGAGVVDVANAATIGEVVPDTHRGRAYGVFWGSRTAAMAIGPFFGGIAGLSGMRWVFLGAGAASLMAVIPVILVIPSRRLTQRPAGIVRPPRTRLWQNRSFVGVAIAFAAVGVVVGVYETCWSLLLTSKGASSWEVGISWTLFAFPFAVMSFPAGWLVDRLDRRYLVAFALLGSATFAMTYPWLGSVPLIICLGSLEAVLTAIGTPAEGAQLAQSVRPDELGRAQGAAASAQTGATAVAALLSGTLFGIHPWLPFVGGSVLILVGVALLGVFWRGVSGRAVAFSSSVDVGTGVPILESPAAVATHSAERTGPLAS
ncbi:MAG TPA: MFS transporter [Acidimicrobiales bacterium]|nr:MFS transporter [Acidimicrobiales bacterium]